MLKIETHDKKSSHVGFHAPPHKPSLRIDVWGVLFYRMEAVIKKSKRVWENGLLFIFKGKVPAFSWEQHLWERGGGGAPTTRNVRNMVQEERNRLNRVNYTILMKM